MDSKKRSTGINTDHQKEVIEAGDSADEKADAPTEAIMTVELLHMDCMEYMKGCEDNAFDLAIVDPPYGIGMGGGKVGNSKKDYKMFHGGDKASPDQSYFNELRRVSKQQIIWGANHFIEHLAINSSCWIAWDKVQPEKFSMAMMELAWSSFGSPAKIYRQRIVSADVERIHPTQKPVKLYKWLLTNYAEKGQRILDTHLGSGSSAIAAHYGGFDFVGCELDEDYYNAACARFDQATRQVAMQV